MFPRMKKPERSALPVYMDEVEFSQLRAVIEAITPKRCLEWGAGGSTRGLLELCPFIERYVCVEHDPAWHANVLQHIQDPRLLLQLVPADVARPGLGAAKAAVIAWDLRAESDPSLMRAYVQFPRTLGMQFDFVLVDGRARTFCLREGFDLLATGGVLVLHDAQRGEYHAAVRSLGRAVFLEPFVQGQVCVVRKV